MFLLIWVPFGWFGWRACRRSPRVSFFPESQRKFGGEAVRLHENLVASPAPKLRSVLRRLLHIGSLPPSGVLLMPNPKVGLKQWKSLQTHHLSCPSERSQETITSTKETKLGEAKTDSDCKVARIFDNVTCLLIPERKFEKVAHRWPLNGKYPFCVDTP